MSPWFAGTTRSPLFKGESTFLKGLNLPPKALPVLAHVPALLPNQLGHPSFQARYGVRANYVAGAMANGIASEDVVIEMAKAGLMGFFGAAGLPTARIAEAIETIQAAIGDLPYGVNLIHSPQVPQQEWDSVALFLERGVQNVSASAFMKLTPAIVWYPPQRHSSKRRGRYHCPESRHGQSQSRRSCATIHAPCTRKNSCNLGRRRKTDPARGPLGHQSSNG